MWPLLIGVAALFLWVSSKKDSAALGPLGPAAIDFMNQISDYQIQKDEGMITAAQMNSYLNGILFAAQHHPSITTDELRRLTNSAFP